MEVGLKMATTTMKSEAESNRKELKFEETELRLGLGLPNEGGESQRKRGFSETVVDLKLNLNNDVGMSLTNKNENDNNNNNNNNNKAAKETTLLLCATHHDPAKPPPKAQVVGWPPVRSYRKNMMTAQKSNTADETAEKGGSSGGAALVKVSMDGAPYLRKVDLTMYKSYQELYEALGKMFSSFTIGGCGSQGMKDLMNERKLMDLLNGSDYVPSYEDKDGDWMLVGDVPWEMFVESCKRLRIMKGTEAVGLAPRAMAKCKNRN